MAMNTDSQALRKRLSEYVNRNATTPEQESDLAGKSLDYLDILQCEESDAGKMDLLRDRLNQEARFKDEEMAYKKETDAADRAMKANIYNQDRHGHETGRGTPGEAGSIAVRATRPAWRWWRLGTAGIAVHGRTGPQVWARRWRWWPWLEAHSVGRRQRPGSTIEP